MRRRRTVIAWVTLVVVSALAAGVVTGGFAALARAGLYATGLWRDGGAATLPPNTFDSPAPPSSEATAASPRPSTPPAAPPAELPAPVLAAATPAEAPRPARVAAAVKGTAGTSAIAFGGSVVDVGSGKVLYDRRAARPLIPASTMKLLSSAAALIALGPQHQFSTRVVQPRRGRIVLVGGGDPYLQTRSRGERASVADLAAATARALQAKDQQKVSLRYDASLFSGPGFNPDWPPGYRSQVSRLSALWVDQGRVGSRRVADPARRAAAAFARALERRGVEVTSIRAGRASRKAAPLASVRSPRLERIVASVLTFSDNDAAEVVFRHAALASEEPGSFAGGQRAVERRLRDLKVWRKGTEIHDGSGLARDNRVPARTLTALLRRAAGSEHPELRALLPGLPVAGVEGGLRARFDDSSSRPGRGLVRAKTGTLSGVYALAGYVRSRDGSVLVFAFLVNGGSGEAAAEAWLDRVTAALSRCGCR